MDHLLGSLETGNEMVVSLLVFHDLDLENVRAMSEFKSNKHEKTSGANVIQTEY